MRQNVCSGTERIIRVVIGVALLSLLFLLAPPYSYFGWLGLIPLATAIFKYCPISHLLGMDTCTMSHRHT